MIKVSKLVGGEVIWAVNYMYPFEVASVVVLEPEIYYFEDNAQNLFWTEKEALEAAIKRLESDTEKRTFNAYKKRDQLSRRLGAILKQEFKERQDVLNKKSYKISKNELLLASALLDIAGDKFGDHGCNDFNIAPFLNRKEREELIKEFHEWNGDPEEYNDKEAESGLFYDFALMHYLAFKLKKKAEEIDG